ncbi:MAG: PD-(D/E)XK nuclease family protein, partial [Mariprofundaceae bacterium]|nr:PD-(D/E)XK nuclease family protein [Mariprofundaceae bacterium]
KQLAAAEKERLAEDMRLLYVALTRASHKLYMAWGSIGSDAPNSALAYLLNCNLHKPQSENHQHIENKTLAVVAEPMVALAAKHVATDTLTTTDFSRKFANIRGISSFTRLTRSIQPQIQYNAPPDDIQDVIFQLPSNRNMGICLHALLEWMDFQADIHTQTHDFLQKHGMRYGVLEHQYETIQQWMNDVIHTTLQDGLCLKDLPKSQRLNELHFDMALPQLNMHRLNQSLQQGTHATLQNLMGSDCQGWLTGEIDLVFEHAGRYYIADYKSNHLGYTLDDYQFQALQNSIMEHRYDVQYLIYTVALHRYLKLRIPDYDYEQHFGGVYYLFLRGMRAEHGSLYGVFFHKPEVALINILDHDIFGKGAMQ